MVLRAAISLKSDTVYVVPVAAVAYIDLVVSAELDTSGRFSIIFESVSFVDGSTFVLSRPRLDAITTADTNFLQFNKALSDTTPVEDSIFTLLLFLRNFVDDTTVTDSSAFVFLPAPQQELVPTLDVTAYEMTKLVQDGFAMNDGSEAVDGSQYSVHKGISNVAFANDSNNLIFNALRVESIGVSDAGALLAQGYCDLSYFAEDYVGAARVF
jgi:hypothetical protein